MLIEALQKTSQTGSVAILEPAFAAGKSVYIKLDQITDTTATWNDLSDPLKAELKSKLVEFQGENVKLGQLAKYYDLRNVDGNILVELTKESENNITIVVNNQIPDQFRKIQKYYVHRTIETRKKLKPEVFKHACNDLFVVQGVQRNELSRLAGDNETDVSGSQIKGITVRFILLEYEGDFESICKLARALEKHAHWIKYQGQSSYEWVKSSGSVKNLQNYVHTSQVQFGEDELGQMENRINVISDSPGKGKTTLLVNIAHTILKNDNTKFIRFIELKEMVQSLKHPEEINLAKIVSILAEQSSEFEFGRKLVENVIKSSPCVLMFDGFDEVLSHQISIASQILKLVATLKYARLFVTTRPHMREELENSLFVLGYTMLPFDDANQLSFTLGYWETMGVERNESVEQFAKSCLTSLSRELSDFENQIAGIPLQCKMIAEAYTKHAERISKVGYEAYQQDHQSIISLTSVFEMYERHMSMRFERIDETKRIKLCERDKDAIKRAHTYLALKLLFPQKVDEFNSLNDESIPLSKICGLGLVEGTHSNCVRFVHRTFAEYFVALFFVEKCDSREHNFEEIFSTSPKKEALQTPFGYFKYIESFEFEFPVVCYFINGFKRRLCKQDMEGWINDWKSSLFYDQVAPIIFACVYHNYVYVLMSLSKLIGATYQQLEESQKMDISDLLLVAANYGDVELMKRLRQKFDMKNIQIKVDFNKKVFMISPLHIAIQRGHYNLVEYLMEQYKEVLTQIPNLLHFCVHRSVGDNKSTLNSKIQIIKLLCTKSKQWLNELLPLGRQPLVHDYVNVELLVCLIEEGADVNVVDNDENTVLHKVFINPINYSSISITPAAYAKLVQAVDKKGFNLYTKMSIDSLTPLHLAVENVEVLESTLQLLHSKGADFNAVSEYFSHPVLFHAIWGGRSRQFLQTLINFGADWNHVNKEGHGVLRICAESQHLEALRYFLEFHQIYVNLEARDTCTPLHRAVLKSTESHEIIQQLLINEGANVNARTKHYKTPFEYGLEKGPGLSLTIIQLMEQRGLVITGKIAYEALKGAFSNTNLKLDSKVIGKALYYLCGIQKTAVFRSHISWNPWTFEIVQKKLPEIISSTNVNSLLLQKAKEFQLLQEGDLKDIEKNEESLKSGCFYELVQRNEESFRNLFMSLLYGKQLRVVSKLIDSLSKDEDEGKVFVTNPPGVTQFKLSKQTKMMVLMSTNLELTICRIQDTCFRFRYGIYVIKNHNLFSQLPIDKQLTIFQSRTVTRETIKKLEQLQTKGGKIICVCNHVIQKIPNLEIYTDSFGWEDVSRNFSSLLRCRFGFSLHNFTDLFATPKIMQVFPEHCLFRNSSWEVLERVLKCIMTDIKVGHLLNEVDGTHLSTAVFHHFLADKLVFLGIAQSDLKKFAKYGQRIGCIGEDIDKLDYIVAGNRSEIEEFIKRTVPKQNVHLIEYKENIFCLVRTWGDGKDDHIKKFIERPQICDNFPACECESRFEQVVFNCSFCFAHTYWENSTCDYSTPLNELLPSMRELLRLQDFIELAEVTKLLEKVSEKRIPEEELQENEEEMSKKKGNFEELEQKIIQLLDDLDISKKEYQDLGKVAESTIFPGRITNQGTKTLERFVTVGLLAQKEESLVVVNQSLSCYLVSNALVNNELTQNLAPDLFRDCIEPHSVRKPIPYFSSGLDTDFSAESTIRFQSFAMDSFKFANGQLLKFVESLAIKNKDVIQDQFKKHIPSNFIVPWVQACVHANHYHLLQILVSPEFYAPSSQSEEVIILAVLYAEVPTIDLLIDKFIQKTSKQVELITLNVSDKEMEKDEDSSSGSSSSISSDSSISSVFPVLDEVVEDAPPPKRYRSDKEVEEGEEGDEEDAPPPQPRYDKEFKTIWLIHLAAMRGDYSVMNYLINKHFKGNLSQRQLQDTLFHTVIDTQYQQSNQIEERKRIIELLLQFSPKLISQRDANYCHWQPLIAPNIHVDLVIFLIEKGLDDKFSLRTILHFCPTYMTPRQYDRLIQSIFSRGKADIFLSTGNSEKTPLDRAVQHFEPLDSTIQVFKSAEFDFNNGIIFTAAKRKERSARLLETLIEAGADFQKPDKDGWSVLHHAAFGCNLSALRYFISQGCDVNAMDSHKNTPLHLVLNCLEWPPLNKILTHELVQVLLQNGADVNVVGEDDCTPLSIAVEMNWEKRLEYYCTLELIKNKAGTS